jgi:hypothetical protein
LVKIGKSTTYWVILGYPEVLYTISGAKGQASWRRLAALIDSPVYVYDIDGRPGFVHFLFLQYAEL